MERKRKGKERNRSRALLRTTRLRRTPTPTSRNMHDKRRVWGAWWLRESLAGSIIRYASIIGKCVNAEAKRPGRRHSSALDGGGETAGMAAAREKRLKARRQKGSFADANRRNASQRCIRRCIPSQALGFRLNYARRYAREYLTRETRPTSAADHLLSARISRGSARFSRPDEIFAATGGGASVYTTSGALASRTLNSIGIAS